MSRRSIRNFLLANSSAFLLANSINKSPFGSDFKKSLSMPSLPRRSNRPTKCDIATRKRLDDRRRRAISHQAAE